MRIAGKAGCGKVCSQQIFQKHAGNHIWDQKNEPTSRPTARWVFTIFEEVLLLYTYLKDGHTVQAMNFRPEHEIVLKSL